MSVVLPAPLGPISASHSPSATSRWISSTTGRPPEDDGHAREGDRTHADAPAGRPQHECEERRAEERGDDPERDLGRRERGARDDVREDEERRPRDDGEREQRAVAAPHEQADRVRDDDPDERDEPADRDRRRGPDRRRRHEQQPRAADVHAQARRLVVTEVEDVDDPPVHEHHDRRDGDVRQQEHDVAPARARDRPQDPRVDHAERVGVLLLHEGLEGGEERRDRDAREDEGRCVAFATRRPADDVRERDRRRAADEREHRGELPAAEPLRQVRDRERRAEPGSGSDAEQVRVRERVPEHALVRRAGEGERPAHERGEDDARHPDLPQDRLLRRRERRRDAGDVQALADGAQDRAEPEVDRADEHADDDGEHEERRRHAGRQPARPRVGGRSQPWRPEWRRRPSAYSRARAADIARKKLTSRGPQRDAIESWTRTIEPVRTALMRSQPGRSATVDGFCPQQTLSASTIRSGLSATMYSAESCG